jgi:hypothetical protein
MFMFMRLTIKIHLEESLETGEWPVNNDVSVLFQQVSADSELAAT